MASAATYSTTARHMDAGFELPLDLETRLHEELVVAARHEQRTKFRPGVNRKSGAALDLVTGERTKKKIARALTVLQDEYGVSETLAKEALAYTNSWEDALSFLALQLASEELPEKLRAKPERRDGDGKADEEDAGSLAVIAAAPSVPEMGPESESLEGTARRLQDAAQTVENWDDDEADAEAVADAEQTKAVEDVVQKEEVASEVAVNAQEVQEAMSWTQRYLLQLEAEEEREKELKRQEAAMTQEEREMRDLENQYTNLNDRLRERKADGKLTKKKQKTLSQDIQMLRTRLIQLGWHEAEYRKKQHELKGEDSGVTEGKKKSKSKEQKQSEDAGVVEPPAVEGDERLFYERDGQQSRLGFRGDEREGGAETRDAPATTTRVASSELTIVEGDADDEDYSGGLFDTPAGDSQSAPKPAPPPPTAEPDADDGKLKTGGTILVGFPASLGSWTGKTPRDLLQDYCQKHKMARPQYKKLSTKGTHLYAITLDKKGAPRQEFAAPDDLFTAKHGFRTIDESKDAVATVALYALTPNLPLYGMMPPPFRALWLEWEREKQAAAASSVDAVKQAFDSLVDEIFHSVPDEIATKTPVQVDEPAASRPQPSATTEVAGDPTPSLTQEPTLDSWDVDDWDDDIPDVEEAKQNEAPVKAEADATRVDSSRHEDDDEPENPVSRELHGVFTRNAKSAQYQKLLPRRNELPIAHYKGTIIQALDKHDVILISGETGCGKSTQVPQYLLEEMVATRVRGSRCQIVCTQPRRLAATSLAERVSHELGEKAMALGDSLCGFQIRLENRMTKHTRLLFCTTGILLRKLQEASTLEEELSHIIVDEVHERDVQNDVLLSMLRTFLETKNKLRRHPLKVILMSATLNAASFQRYFGGESKCPMLSVPGRTFPVEEFYLEDAVEATQFVVDETSPSYRRPEESGAMQSTKVTVSGRGGTSYTQRVTWNDTRRGATSGRHRDGAGGGGADEYSDRTLLTLERLDESVINYELIEQLIEHLVTESDAVRLDEHSSHASAAILVFMPGLQEISNLLDVLSGNRYLRDAAKFELLPLHSSLSPEDQRRIFDMRRGVVRIIATTNIAETSLTIEDVKVVIDSGRAKEMRHDSTTKTNLLEEIWVSRANAKQRLGRAGRTSGGTCYRLFSRATFQHGMPEQPLPEIKRAPLTSLCLQIKTFGVESSCAEFLEGCLDPPEVSSVNDALRELYEIGALEVDAEDSRREKLTTLGSHLAQLPVDVKVGKLLLLGAIFGEFDAVSTCAAVLETKSPFIAPYGYQKEMQAARQHFAVASSDLLTDANAFHAWRARFLDGGARGRRSEEKAFCRQYFLSTRSLMEIVKLKKQFAGIVAQLGFLDRAGATPQAKPLTVASCTLLSALLYAGLEPNVMYVDPALSSSHRVGLRAESDRGTTRAFVHPGSVNAKTTAYASPFLAYAVKLHTSQVYVPSCSMVLPSALCVFSFAMEIVFPHHAARAGDVTVKLNEWIPLRSSLRSAVLLQEVRALVRTFVDGRIASPPFRHGSSRKESGREEEPTAQAIVGALVALFQHEFDARDPKQALTRQLNPPLK